MPSGKQEKKAMDSGGASKSSSSEAKTPKALKTVKKIVKKSQNHDSANAGEAKSAPVSQKKSAKIEEVKATPQAQGKTKNDKTKAQEGNKDTNAINNIEKQVDIKKEVKGLVDQKKGVLSTKKSDNNHNGDNGKGIVIEGTKETSQSDQKNKRKRQSDQNNKEKSQVEEKKKEQLQIGRKDNAKLGGLILMCNGRTKPDCLRYMVMGLPASRQELIMRVKPGLKLFLYDFDLRVLHGIYEAASPGGMKLEPAAFNGAFPAQVRYKVYKDCMPVPESIFKDAIKENYDEKKNRFKTELTFQQVRKLSELFHPIILHPNAHPAPIPVHVPPVFHPLPGPIVSLVCIPENRREAASHAQQGLSSGQPYLLNNARGYEVSPQEFEREQLPKYTASKQRESERERLPKYAASNQREFERERLPEYAASNQREFERERLPEYAASNQREFEREQLPEYAALKQRQYEREQLPKYGTSQHREYEREQPPKYNASKQREYEREQPPKYTTSKQREYEREQPPKYTTSKQREYEREQPSKYTSSKQREYEREQPHKYAASKQRDDVPAHRETAPRDPLALSEKEYRTFGLARAREPAPPTSAPSQAATTVSASLDPYRSSGDHYYAHLYSGSSSSSYPQTSLEPHSLLPRRETDPIDYDLHRRRGTSQDAPTMSTAAHLGQSYGIPRRAEVEYGGSFNETRTDEAERIYSAHAANSASDYSRTKQHHGGRPDVASLPVSSRYSFTGMSSSYH